MPLSRLFRRLFGLEPAPRQPIRWQHFRPRLEHLEDRLTPAHNITIATGGSVTIPAGASSFSDTGNYTIAPSALNAVASGTIALRANNDIAINNDLFLADGVGLTALAGRSLTVTGSG